MGKRARARHVFHAVALVIGAVALGFLIHTMGWDGIERVLVGAGPWFLAIALVDLTSVVFDTLAIQRFLGDARPALGRTFAAQSSGVAINRLTPGHSAGEAVKVTMLVEHVHSAAAVSSIVMFNLATIGIAIAAIVGGVPLTLLLLDLPGRVQIVVWVAAGLLVAVAVVVLVLVRRGALGARVTAARRLRLVSDVRAVSWHAKVAATDARIREFGRPGSRLGIFYVFVSRCCNWTGTLCVMAAANAPLTAPLVVAMLSVGILITWASNVIPLGLGTADGLNYALYGVLGSSGPVGLAFTMINRARTFVLALMGLTVMLIASLADRVRRGT